VLKVLQGGVAFEIARRSRPWQEQERKRSGQRGATGFEFHNGPLFGRANELPPAGDLASAARGARLAVSLDGSMTVG